MQQDFVEIDHVLVNTEVFETNFTCDLVKCKGACCTMESEFGAPITKEEIEKIEAILPIVKKYLPANHIKEIELSGFWMEKHGELMTRSVDNRACVFVTYDGDIAKCAIEKACRDGKTDFLKPISCHLFPIRISNFGGSVVRFEKYSECQPALELGNKTKIKVFDFCRDPLERLYGKEWFEKTKEAVD